MLIKKTRAISFTIVCLFFVCCIHCAGAESEFNVRFLNKPSGYSRNEILVHVPEPGTVRINIQDEHNCYRVLTRNVQTGDNLIIWDGLGWNEERLISKRYTVISSYLSDSQITKEITSFVDVGISGPALLFALSSADTVYLEEADSWFVELKQTLPGTVFTEFYQLGSEKDEPDYIRSLELAGGSIISLPFDKLAGKDLLPAGNWVVKMYAKGGEDYVRSFDLKVEPGRQSIPEIKITGSIMPTLKSSDEEIWEKMMMPSVVVDIPPLSHQKVYIEADPKSKVLGTLHGQSQAVEVLDINNQWAYINAWNHEEAENIYGWVPVRVLKIAYPRQEYGLLLDKKQQTLTVFYKGRRKETLLISSGRMEAGQLYQETAAGSFLTDVHRPDFSSNGMKYDYVIRYDGGNLLHQIPYYWGEGKKDFRAGSVYLGTKASHACVRIQALPGKNELNAYWLWTHIPYHTRLIILDDPEERLGEKSIIQGSMNHFQKDVMDSWEIISENDEKWETENSAVLTFGGDVVLGGRESYYGIPDGLPSYIEKYGKDYPFSGLQALFSQDDLTIVNLECVLKNDAKGEDKKKRWRFRGLTDYADILPISSIELVNLANNHTFDYGEEGYLSTVKALDSKVYTCGFGNNPVLDIKGHLFGFGACRETSYLEAPETIERDIMELKSKGAEYIIYQCHWGEEYNPYHSVLQEAMARTCARAGADLVVGHHPHIVQGIDFIGDVPVIYSLGNLMFGGTINLTNWDGLLVQAKFSFDTAAQEKITLHLIPVHTSSKAEDRMNDYCPQIADSLSKAEILKQIQADTPFLLKEYFSLTNPD